MSLRVAQIGFFSDPRQRTPAELLEAWPTLVDVAESAARAKLRVCCLQECALRASLHRNDVSYHFLPFGRDAASILRPDGWRSILQPLRPDVLHVHGLDFAREVSRLADLAPGVPILLQDHASRPPRLWHRPRWRRGCARAAGMAFCALEQAQPFASAGLLPPRLRLFELPESTSRFTPGDREHARREAQVSGEPLVLWVGHLDANKDPLTVLDALAVAARLLPGMRLYMCYGSAPLLEEVRRRCAAHPSLRGRVHLLGSVPHERIEQLMRAADVFVLGSHREGSGYALIEALACGLPPIVTDIPSFRALTCDGEIGRLWPCGDAAALCRALLQLAPRVDEGLRARVRAHFEQELSFDALGIKLAAVYRALAAAGHSSDGRREASSEARSAPAL